MGRATITGGVDAAATYAISIHALRGEGDKTAGLSANQYMISIHALRGEGDVVLMAVGVILAYRISIHALRGEGDAAKLRDAMQKLDFNPRPPWGGRHAATGKDR